MTCLRSAVRNPFDQYRHHENRLTHALACCLAEDRQFMRAFLRWATGEVPPKAADLRIVEQSLPGEPEAEEEEPEKRGLPDAWIYSDDGWSLLVESKVAAPISQNQIRRHLETADRRGFADRRLLVLSVSLPHGEAKFGVHHRTWKDLYRWVLAGEWKTAWPRMFVDYMEAAEGRMLTDGYLKEGTLTTFTGIPFGEDTPYSYREAKRLLKLLMDDLRARTALAEKLGANLPALGRKAITGTGANSVWDFLRLGEVEGDAAFTKHPHLTLSVGRDRVLVQITIPNGMDGRLRKALVGLGFDGFNDTLAKVLKAASAVLAKDPGAVPYFMLLQRHYPTQRSEPITDATLEFDLRTAFTDDASDVKAQPEWLGMAFHSFANKRSNLQLSVGISFPYRRSVTVEDAKFADMVERSWLACGPLLKAMNLN